MTQAPPAPAQGIAATPVALTAGVAATVAFPTLPNGGPVPWRTPWVTILNSSPFTLLVTSGATTTQIAAFTSDKVFVVSQGSTMPVTVLPIAGSQTLLIGTQDSTAYATWYASEPPGAYPSALGSGAALFAQAAALIPATSVNPLANGATTTFLGASGTSIGGFGGMTLTVAMILSGPLYVQVNWLDASGAIMATKSMIVGTTAIGQAVQVQLAHQGPFVQVLVTNNSGGNVGYTIFAMNTVQARTGFNVAQSTGANGGGSYLINTTTTSAAASATTVIASSGAGATIFGGNAQLRIDLGGLAIWELDLQQQSNTGAWVTFGMWKSGALNPTGDTIPVLVPPNPLRLQVVNGSGLAVNCTADVIADDWRAA